MSVVTFVYKFISSFNIAYMYGIARKAIEDWMKMFKKVSIITHILYFYELCFILTTKYFMVQINYMLIAEIVIL